MNFYKKELKLYEHQKEAIFKVIANDGTGGLIHDVGCGKTITTFEIFRLLRAIKPHLKMIVFCPLGILEAQGWGDKIKDWTNCNYYNCHSLKGNYQNGTRDIDIYLINYRSLISKKHQQRLFNLLQKHEFIGILDECFTGDTIVDTEKGQMPISEIKEGDRVINCVGLSKVIKTFKRIIPKYRNLVVVRMPFKKIICSEDHLFFTFRGWIKAKDLTKEDMIVTTNYSMRLVSERTNQRTISEQHIEKKEISKDKGFLFHELFSEMENVRSRHTLKDIYIDLEKESNKQYQESISGKSRICQEDKQENDRQKSNEKGRNKDKSQQNFKENKTQTINTGWEWERYSKAAIDIVQNDKEEYISRSGNGVCTEIRKERVRLSKPLQNRYCLTESKDSYRGRRKLTLFKKGSRYKKNKETHGVRVESVEIQKSTSSLFDQYRDESGRVILYDLQIENHPSFSVDGLLVHNSHRAKNHKAQTSKVLNGYYRSRKWIEGYREHLEHRLILTGTADPNTRLEWFSQCLFLTEDIFGKKITNFRQRYFYLERESWHGDKEVLEVGGNYYEHMKKGYKLSLIPKMKDEFYHQINKYIHFAKKDECLDLPEQIDEVRSLPMSDEQQKMYRQMERDLVIEFSEMDEVTANYALTRIQKLIQIANGFVIDDNQNTHVIKSNKLDELNTLVEELGDQQVIIWGHYIKQIELILQKLGDKAIGFKGNDHSQVLRDFTSGKYKCLVANPQSKSEGLDLQNANVQIFASLNYSLLEYIQCRGRTHRPGQKRNCLYLHLLSSGSIEEEIYLALQGKKSEQEIALGIIKRIKSANKYKKYDQKKVPVGIC